MGIHRQRPGSVPWWLMPLVAGAVLSIAGIGALSARQQEVATDTAVDVAEVAAQKATDLANPLIVACGGGDELARSLAAVRLEDGRPLCGAAAQVKADPVIVNPRAALSAPPITETAPPVTVTQTAPPAPLPTTIPPMVTVTEPPTTITRTAVAPPPVTRTVTAPPVTVTQPPVTQIVTQPPTTVTQTYEPPATTVTEEPPPPVTVTEEPPTPTETVTVTPEPATASTPTLPPTAPTVQPELMTPTEQQGLTELFRPPAEPRMSTGPFGLTIPLNPIR